MRDKTILITGATSGIGYQTAMALAKMGARVIVTGRNQTSGQAAVDELKRASGNSQVSLLLGDLSTRTGVRALSGQFSQQFDALDVLINNAGLAPSMRQLTEDGVESSFAVNVVAPFVLTHLLMDQLRASSAARVVNVTGGSHPAEIDLTNTQAERSFAGLNTYSHAKLMMMAVMYEYARRVDGSSISINVCYPGQASTAMTQGVTPDMAPLVLRALWPLYRWMTRPDNGRSAAKAAQSSIHLAASAAVAGVNATYFSARCIVTPWPAAVLDSNTRERLWAKVEQLR